MTDEIAAGTTLKIRDNGDVSRSIYFKGPNYTSGFVYARRGSETLQIRVEASSTVHTQMSPELARELHAALGKMLSYQGAAEAHALVAALEVAP